jgi:hypothetical protein
MLEQRKWRVQRRASNRNGLTGSVWLFELDDYRRQCEMKLETENRFRNLLTMVFL